MNLDKKLSSIVIFSAQKVVVSLARRAGGKKIQIVNHTRQAMGHKHLSGVKDPKAVTEEVSIVVSLFGHRGG